MKRLFLMLVALVALGATHAIASEIPIGDDRFPVCSQGTDRKCDIASTDQCISYRIVTIQLGTTIKVERVCEEKVVTTKFYYWTS